MDRCKCGSYALNDAPESGLCDVCYQKARVAALEAERDALRERCEKLEWLVEVQEFCMYRLRNPGGWSTPGMERAKIGVAWQRRSAANDELRAMYMDALAATEVKS